MKKLIPFILQVIVIQSFTFAKSSSDWELVCPGDVTVSCADLKYDYNFYYGKAYTMYKSYQQYIHDCKVIVSLNDCGVGYIKRVWGAVNPENNEWVTCTQIITVEAQGSFGNRDISWPPSIEIRSCDPAGDLKKLGKPYDRPYWSTTRCAKPMFAYSDSRYRINDGCEKIVREWKVLDWCVYDPYKAPNRGVFTAIQVIKLITDDTSAQLTCKKEIVVTNDKTCDKVFVSIDKAIFQSACNLPHIIRNTSDYSSNKGDDASGEYPNGTTTFYYIAEYACGYETKCEVTVKVLPGVPPTPYCLTGVISTLMPVDADKNGIPESGMVEIWASDLNHNCFHLCPKRTLSYSFSKDRLEPGRTFTCSELGENEVEIWVRDQYGNQDVCKTKIHIQNNNPSIPNCTDSITIGKKSYKIVDGSSSVSSPDFGANSQISDRSINSAREYFHVFPNPVQSDQHLLLKFKMSNSPQVLQFNLWDANGKLKTNKSFELQKGENNFSIEMSEAIPGLYFAEIKTDHFHQFTKVIVKH